MLLVPSPLTPPLTSQPIARACVDSHVLQCVDIARNYFQIYWFVNEM